MSNYKIYIQNAFETFWQTRDGQAKKQIKKDAGTRGAVTWWKQLDGFLELFTKVAIDAGIPKKYIYTKGNILPWYFRPTKNWDFLIISPGKHLIACIELKSQVGSFGNNFNNRVEEAIGNSTDLWKAFEEWVFSAEAIAPWLGFFMIVEKSSKSTAIVKLQEPHYKAMKEFQETSYLDRYSIFCEKLIRQKLYNNTALLSTSNQPNIKYSNVKQEIWVENFIDSLAGFLSGKKSFFQD